MEQLDCTFSKNHVFIQYSLKISFSFFLSFFPSLSLHLAGEKKDIEKI